MSNTPFVIVATPALEKPGVGPSTPLKVPLMRVAVRLVEAEPAIRYAGAIVGGIAGHMAGHGKLGAAAGCVVGHHEANKKDSNHANTQAPPQQK